MAARVEDRTDCIIVQTDVAFNLGLEVMSELNKSGHLKVETLQIVSIQNIESNAVNVRERFIFGGKNAGNAKKRQVFARTASAVLRMCMLESSKVDPRIQPTFGPHSMMRNRNKMSSQQFGPEFVLTRDKGKAMKYYSHYNHTHPHFKIEEQLLEVEEGQWWYMPPTMMLVFQNNFTRVIEFGTTFRARYRTDLEAGTYQSYVNVRCVVRNISNNEHISVKMLKALASGETESIMPKLREFVSVLKLPADDEIDDPRPAPQDISSHQQSPPETIAQVPQQVVDAVAKPGYLVMTFDPSVMNNMCQQIKGHSSVSTSEQN